MEERKRYQNRLKDLREDNDLTQDQLVNILKMHKTTYTRYEQGVCDIPLEFAKQMALFYNVSIDYIAGLTNNPKTLDGSKYTYKSKNITINNNGNGYKFNIKG